jgi:hypothetical protein
MVTTVGSERQRESEAKTVKRMYLLQWQVRNLLRRTTDISKGYLEKIGGKGIENRWLSTIEVYGFDQSNRCQVGVQLHINWLTYTVEVMVWGEEVRINKTVFADDLAPEVMNAIEIFNQAINAELLRTEWRVTYAVGVDVARVRRELGLSPARPLTWAGKVTKQSYPVAEFPELTVSLLIAESDEPVPESQEQRKYPHKEKDLFDRIKDAFG